VLADLTDSGNASPMPLRKRTSTEADREDSYHRRNSAEDKENISLEDSENLMPKALTRAEKRRSGGFTGSIVPMSPMKRHDGPMNLDLESFGSPSAKRRSVHGPLCPDFSVFDKFNDEQRSQDDNNWQMGNSSLSSSRNNTIPKRFSSLRKSTLQQRQSDKTGQSRRSPVQEVDFSSPVSSPAFNFNNLKKGETRLSLDNRVPPMGRDSPFSSQGPLFNASVHPVVPSAQNSQSQSYIHPLSRTMTQSSSTTSIQDESPTHEPFRRPERPVSLDFSSSSVHDFSKSMPIGVTRPTGSQESSSQGSFATPAHYKFAKPLPMAFMSTGLISKKNRNANEPNAGLPKAHMPDTPCKKQFTAADMYLPIKDAARSNRHSFRTPSTPFNPQSAQRKVSFASIQGRSIFGSNARNSSKRLLNRKSSFASIEDLDKSLSQSPTSKGDSQSTDTEYPPTPTRHPHVAPSPHHGPKRLFISFGSSQGSRFPSSKLSPIRASPGSVDEDSDSVMEDSPSANLRLNSSLTAATEFSSFTRSRVLQNFNSPTPFRAMAFGVVPPHSPKSRTKIASSPVSSQAENNDRLSPHTPLEAVFPPDPSGLSISGRHERVNNRPGTANSFKSIPATPTGPREYFAAFSNGPNPILAAPDALEVDESLAARFDSVELVGAGEFSQVYRVAQPPKTSPYHSHFAISVTRSPSRSSSPERVWAVKKSKHPYAGPKDRLRKIREVDVLKSLGHSDHILAFVESWEADRHLYIQTEFCEEGSLDKFLLRTGQGGILDTFRTWKILLELSLGLQHIHDAGFIHLDLKPANVLITFEGVLKIADFGMATRWPATGAIEGEGDRQYLGPEVLEDRQFDKPADIFALGLIMVETACNVELPDNGKSWQKLRSDDLSEVPSLTWNSEKEGSVLFRNSKGEALDEELLAIGEEHYEEHDNVGIAIHEDDVDHHPSVHKLTKDELSVHLLDDGNKTLLPLTRTGELSLPPTFMLEAKYQSSLDTVVRCLLSRDPTYRPSPKEILRAEGLQWVQNRRRAGASVYEGDWGPADDLLSDDAEMIDV
jgi:mitosis inhibitor protein kinase SWE1